MQNLTATYPEEYHMILLKLKADGTPISFELSSEAEAHAERLRYYNFLKWCRRPKNAMATAHLAGRYNQVQMLVSGNVLTFRLKTPARAEALRSGLHRMVAEGLLDDLPAVPASANPRALNELPKGEAWPLMPELSQPAPAIGFAQPDEPWMRESNERLMQAQEIARATPREKEFTAVSWFPPRRQRALNDSPQDQWSPQKRLTAIADSLIIGRQFDYVLPFPTKKDDSHEVSETVIGKVFKEWNTFLLETGWMDWLTMETEELGWRFTLTEAAKEALAMANIAMKVRFIASPQEENEIKLEVLKLFNQGETQ